MAEFTVLSKRHHWNWKTGSELMSYHRGWLRMRVDKYEAYFPGHNPIPMNKVINGYVKSVEGKGTGEIIRMYDNC